MGSRRRLSQGGARGVTALAAAAALAAGGGTSIGWATTHQDHAPQPTAAVAGTLDPGSSGPASRNRVSPSRNGTVTASCGVCGAPLPTGKQRLWCSDACRQSAWRRRHTTTVAPVELPAARLDASNGL